VDKVEQYVYHVGRQSKTALMIHLLKKGDIDTALVFIRTKRNADRLGSDLKQAGIRADVIHGDKSQSSRENALDKFKKRKVKVLVATDIAARGLDIDELSHVINYNVPEDPESYVHRIGRTARAGLGGVAITLCDREEKKYLADIQRLIAKNLTEVTDHPYSMEGKPTHAHRPSHPVQRSHARPAGKPPVPGTNPPRPPQAKKQGPQQGGQPRQGQAPQQPRPKPQEQRPAPRQAEGPRTTANTVKPHHPAPRPAQPPRSASGHRPPYVAARPHMAKDAEKPVSAPVIPENQPEEKPRRVPLLQRLKKRMGMEDHK
jgi:ATP-dependent RNA helicase RhlE